MSTDTLEALDRRQLVPGFMADPYPVYHELRSRAPVFWSEAMGYWMLTRYDDVRATLRDFRRFTNTERIHRFLDQLPAPMREMAQPIYENFSVGMPNTDPPEHTRVRALVNKAFTPRIVDGMRPRVQAIVDGLLDAVQDAGRMDLIRDFAYPLPAIVIAEMLGVPPDDRDQFKQWSDEIVGIHTSGRPDVDLIERGARAIRETKAWLRELAAERRREPQEDLLTGLVMAEEQGRVLNETELLSTCVTVLTAGHETTTGLIGNGMLALQRHPDQLRLLKDDPGQIPAAIDELLRYDTPFQRGWRLATQDTEIRGQQIRKGQTVSLIFGAACRDPEWFPEPDRFDVRREQPDQLAFGSGVHYCIGAPLARREAEIAFATILRRLPDIRLGAGEIEWAESNTFHNIQSMPMEWS